MWGLVLKVSMRSFSQRPQFCIAFFYNPELAIGIVCVRGAHSWTLLAKVSINVDFIKKVMVKKVIHLSVVYNTQMTRVGLAFDSDSSCPKKYYLHGW